MNHARSEAEKVARRKIDPRSADVNRLTKQMRRDNQDAVGEKPVDNDECLLSLDEDGKNEAWEENYERLLIVDFSCNPEDLSVESPVDVPSEPITSQRQSTRRHLVRQLDHQESMLKPLGEAGVTEEFDLVKDIISEGCIQTDWQESFNVILYKGKGDALNRVNYRGLQLTEQTMKELERVVKRLIRQRVEIDEIYCGFMSGRGTSTDAISIVRQLQEHLDVRRCSTLHSLHAGESSRESHGMSSGGQGEN